MKQVQIGIDLVEIIRIKQAISNWKERFLHRIYTDTELELYSGKVESLAARFAGKEAVLKALNMPGTGIRWKDIEILSEDNGKPVVRLHGKALIQAYQLGFKGFEISLSHSRENAIAFVIGIPEV
jgi:holo-[acyl-carrier protein] synthase